MTDYVLHCDAFVRLTNVLHDFHPDTPEWCKTVRIDNGQAVATNRFVMAVENIGGPGGVVHVIPDPALIAQCRTEAPLGGKLTITVNEMLRFAVAKTSYGYIHPGNCVMWDGPTHDFDAWRKVVMRCKEPAEKSVGGMYWRADDVARLAAASPSGHVVFEQLIDAHRRPTIIRDIHDPDWLGIFDPFTVDARVEPATMPKWMTL